MNRVSILGCALNLSEGRLAGVVDRVARAGASAAHVLDVSSDPDHNRTVITLCGHPEPLVRAVIDICRQSLQNIDLNRHRGVHPRLGVVDVIPFYPLNQTSMNVAVAAARACGQQLWEQLALPSFLYEQAASRPEAGELPWVRKNAFTLMTPDFGGPQPHPTAGAAVVGARGLLVAYNVDLATDLPTARRIAATVRTQNSGNIRTLGLYLQSRGAAQVSMNILTPGQTTLVDAYRAVAHEAKALKVQVLGSEIIGLVPRACLGEAGTTELGLRRDPKVLEDQVDNVCID